MNRTLTRRATALIAAAALCALIVAFVLALREPPVREQLAQIDPPAGARR